MSAVEMDPALTAAVRAELAAIGTRGSRLQRHQRRARALAIGVAVLVVAIATTGAALVATHFPGSTTVTPMGQVHTGTGTGNGAVDLGPVPPGADRVVLTVRCLADVGSFSIAAVPQSAGMGAGFTTFYCRGGGRVDSHGTVHPWRMDDAALPPRGSTSIAITADPGTRWKVSGRYASSSTTPWSRNARGETYGQCNVDGCPDLIGAQATNGAIGFIRQKDWGPENNGRFIPVYESDGTTVIGRFGIGATDGG